MGFSAGKVSSAEQSAKSGVLAVSNAYNSPWNDQVHNSFGAYVNVLKDQITKLDEVVEKTEKICTELNKLKIDEKIKQAKELSKSAEELAKTAEALAERTVG